MSITVDRHELGCFANYNLSVMTSIAQSILEYADAELDNSGREFDTTNLLIGVLFGLSDQFRAMAEDLETVLADFIWSQPV